VNRDKTEEDICDFIEVPRLDVPTILATIEAGQTQASNLIHLVDRLH
jgi:hypothetical protein